MSFLNSIKNNSSKHVAPFDHWEYSDALSERSIEEIIKSGISALIISSIDPSESASLYSQWSKGATCFEELFLIEFKNNIISEFFVL